MVNNEESKAIERMMKGCLLGSCVYHRDVLESTQIEAKRLAGDKTPEGTLVIARTQTKAYGRRRTAWFSPVGGLWFSLVLYPKFGPSVAENFSLAVARSIQSTLEKNIAGISFEVRAPNDILAVTGSRIKKKVCGIILEGEVVEDRYNWLILGVGLNVNNIIDESLKDTAVSLEELTGKPASRMPLLKTVLQDLTVTYLQVALA